MSDKLKEILKSLTNLKEEIRKKYKTEIIGVFGSFVRNEEKEYSDIDILARFSEGATLLDMAGLGNFLEERLHLKVDIVPIDTIREEIKGQILSEAIYL